jgi:hypothetical protein
VAGKEVDVERGAVSLLGARVGTTYTDFDNTANVTVVSQSAITYFAGQDKPSVQYEQLAFKGQAGDKVAISGGRTLEFDGKAVGTYDVVQRDGKAVNTIAFNHGSTERGAEVRMAEVVASGVGGYGGNQIERVSVYKNGSADVSGFQRVTGDAGQGQAIFSNGKWSGSALTFSGVHYDVMGGQMSMDKSSLDAKRNDFFVMLVQDSNGVVPQLGTLSDRTIVEDGQTRNYFRFFYSDKAETFSSKLEGGKATNQRVGVEVSFTGNRMTSSLGWFRARDDSGRNHDYAKLADGSIVFREHGLNGFSFDRNAVNIDENGKTSTHLNADHAGKNITVGAFTVRHGFVSGTVEVLDKNAAARVTSSDGQRFFDVSVNFSGNLNTDLALKIVDEKGNAHLLLTEDTVRNSTAADGVRQIFTVETGSVIRGDGNVLEDGSIRIDAGQQLYAGFANKAGIASDVETYKQNGEAGGIPGSSDEVKYQASNGKMMVVEGRILVQDGHIRFKENTLFNNVAVMRQTLVKGWTPWSASTVVTNLDKYRVARSGVVHDEQGKIVGTRTEMMVALKTSATGSFDRARDALVQIQGGVLHEGDYHSSLDPIEKKNIDSASFAVFDADNNEVGVIEGVKLETVKESAWLKTGMPLSLATDRRNVSGGTYFNSGLAAVDAKWEVKTDPATGHQFLRLDRGTGYSYSGGYFTALTSVSEKGAVKGTFSDKSGQSITVDGEISVSTEKEQTSGARNMNSISFTGLYNGKYVEGKRLDLVYSYILKNGNSTEQSTALDRHDAFAGQVRTLIETGRVDASWDKDATVRWVFTGQQESAFVAFQVDKGVRFGLTDFVQIANPVAMIAGWSDQLFGTQSVEWLAENATPFGLAMINETREAGELIDMAAGGAALGTLFAADQRSTHSSSLRAVDIFAGEILGTNRIMNIDYKRDAWYVTAGRVAFSAVEQGLNVATFGGTGIVSSAGKGVMAIGWVAKTAEALKGFRVVQALVKVGNYAVKVESAFKTARTAYTAANAGRTGWATYLTGRAFTQVVGAGFQLFLRSEAFKATDTFMNTVQQKGMSMETLQAAGQAAWGLTVSEIGWVGPAFGAIPGGSRVVSWLGFGAIPGGSRVVSWLGFGEKVSRFVGRTGQLVRQAGVFATAGVAMSYANYLLNGAPNSTAWGSVKSGAIAGLAVFTVHSLINLVAEKIAVQFIAKDSKATSAVTEFTKKNYATGLLGEAGMYIRNGISGASGGVAYAVANGNTSADEIKSAAIKGSTLGLLIGGALKAIGNWGTAARNLETRQRYRIGAARERCPLGRIAVQDDGAKIVRHVSFTFSASSCRPVPAF